MNVENKSRNQFDNQFSKNNIYIGIKERVAKNALYLGIGTSVILLINYINNNSEEIEQFIEEHFSFLK